ncbi:MAG TPA: hypothetical protein VI248_23670 [Kineosporiaceae bacterium]
MTAAVTLAVAGLTSTVSMIGSASAATFDGPNGHHQFLQIAAKESGSWTAHMTLHDSSGKTVYTWKENPRGMHGKATWWYTLGGGYVDGDITLSQGPDSPPTVYPFRYTADDADGHCWRVNWQGADYTGDTNGSCTPS